MSLSERKKLILKTVVESYIETAEPVSSKAVIERLGLMFSSATVRNEMAELEELGYMVQPHTSAGRIPTHMGYRLYVNSLMHRYELTFEEMKLLNDSMRTRISEFDRIIAEAGRALSTFTGLMGVASLNISGNGYIKRFELAHIDDTTLVLIMITGDGVIKNVVVKTRDSLEEEYLIQLKAFLNRHLTFKNLNEIVLIEHELGKHIPQEYFNIFKQVVSAMLDAIKESDRENVFLKGMPNILSYPEYRDVSVTKPLLDFMSDSRQMSKMLSAITKEDGVNISIGEENEVEQMRSSSVLVSTYTIGSHPAGILGIVGPTRMDYSKMITCLDYFSKGLSRLLGEIYSEDDAKDE